ncbi:MAG: hypothetical protein AAF288_07630 [Planctomycetota bacterium]
MTPRPFLWFFCVCCLAPIGLTHGQGFTADQAIEVREGDVWSPATFVRKEGRRSLIRYEDGTEEWVPADRMRAPVEGDANSGEGENADPAAPAAPPPAKQWTKNQPVEVKWNSSYWDATVVDRRGQWYLIEYERHGGWREWVEPWRIRARGAVEDPVGRANPNPRVRNRSDGPPTARPGPPTEPTGIQRRANQPAAVYANDPAYKTPSRDSAQLFDLTNPDGFAPDPAQGPALRARPLLLRGQLDGSFASVEHVRLPRGDGPPMAMVQHTAGMSRDKKRQVERVDLAAGRSLGLHELPSETDLLAAAPGATRFALRSDVFGFGGKGRLELYDWPNPGRPTRTAIFRPVASDTDVAWAHFAGPQTLVTVDSAGELVVWDLETFEARFLMTLERNALPAVSPGGAQLAVAVGKTIHVLNPVAGRSVFSKNVEMSGPVRLAFSPSGAQLAAVAQNHMAAWDLATGEALADFSTPSDRSFGRSAIAMPDEGYALVGSRLIDLTQPAHVWTYQPGHGVTPVVGPHGRVWYAAERNDKPALASIEAPHAEAARVQAGPADKLLEPGDGLALQVRISAPSRERSDITQRLGARIQSAGYRLDPDAPVRLIALTEKGPTTQREFAVRRFGAMRERVYEVNVTPHIARAELHIDGRVVWQAQAATGIGPTHVRLEEGQTPQQAVDAQAFFPLQVFRNLNLPRHLIDLQPAPGAGTSQLTAMGLQ